MFFFSDWQEPQKPDDALGYLKKSVGGSLEDKKTIEALHKENEELKKKVTLFAVNWNCRRFNVDS